jgi:MFS family permease
MRAMSRDSLRTRSLARATGWLGLWRPILPLLAAEFILWTGFGALLPVMPLYFTAHGVDIALLGVVIAAWPAARLFTEPVFGYIADRTARVPLMVMGLVVAGVSVGAMALWTAPAAFVLLRAGSGLGTAMYDPAARGYLNDSAPAGRRGEAFGLYNAAQQGGILFGPAIGGLGTALVGSYVFVTVLAAVTTISAAVAVALRVREVRAARAPVPSPGSLAEFPAERDLGSSQANGAEPAEAWLGAPISLRNRFIAAALLVNLAGYFGGGLYETIWALFVTSRGGGVGLVGLTFATFGLTTIVLSSYGGRMVDRHGPFRFVVLGLLVMAVMMVSYPFVAQPLLYVPMVAVEAVGFAFLGPATYAVIARGTPAGRSSTAQGIAGSAGTVGAIAASLATGVLAARNLSLPFFVGTAVVVALLGVTLLVAGRPLREMGPSFVRSGPVG